MQLETGGGEPAARSAPHRDGLGGMLEARAGVDFVTAACCTVETGVEPVSLEITTERGNGVLVAWAGGRIDGANAGDFESAVQAAARDFDGPVILDCEDLPI